MDYPKSVPSVGLVGGKFVDENPVAGTPGSLIPAQWGNAVSDEILNVITSAGLVPDEELDTQLGTAISLIINDTRPLASQAEAEAGIDNSKVMTALRVIQSIAKRLPANAPVVGTARNLRCVITSASVTAIVTADEIVVKNALGGASMLLSSFNKTVNLGQVGAGGMDIISAPINGFVALYAIHNPSTGSAALIATNATNTVQSEIYLGNLPQGYVASGLISVLPTTGAGLFAPCQQEDRHVDLGSAVTAVNSTAIGGPFSVTVAGLPKNARSIDGNMTVSSTAASAMSLSLFSSELSAGQKICNVSVAANGQQTVTFSGSRIRTPQQVRWAASNSAGSSVVIISVTGYDF